MWIEAVLLLLTSRLSHRSAQLLSHYRPRALIIALTRNEQVARQVHLCRGVFPVLYRGVQQKVWADDVDRRVQFSIEMGKCDPPHNTCLTQPAPLYPMPSTTFPPVPSPNYSTQPPAIPVTPSVWPSQLPIPLLLHGDPQGHLAPAAPA